MPRRLDGCRALVTGAAVVNIASLSALRPSPAGVSMDADAVARAVAEGVWTNAAHVVTHPGGRAAMEQRFAVLPGAIGEAAKPGYAPTA